MRGLSEHEDRSGGKRRGRRCWQGQRGARGQSINRERYQSSPYHFPQKTSSRRYYTIKGKPIAAVCGSIYWKLCCYSAASSSLMSLSNNAPIICQKEDKSGRLLLYIKGGTQRLTCFTLCSPLLGPVSKFSSKSKMRNSLIWWGAATTLALACCLSITKAKEAAFDEEDHANFVRRANPLRWGKRDHLRERRDAPLR